MGEACRTHAGSLLVGMPEWKRSFGSPCLRGVIILKRILGE